MRAVQDAEHRVLHRDPHGYCAHPHLVRCGGELLVVFNWSPRRASSCTRRRSRWSTTC